MYLSILLCLKCSAFNPFMPSVLLVEYWQIVQNQTRRNRMRTLCTLAFLFDKTYVLQFSDDKK